MTTYKRQYGSIDDDCFEMSTVLLLGHTAHLKEDECLQDGVQVIGEYVDNYTRNDILVLNFAARDNYFSSINNEVQYNEILFDVVILRPSEMKMASLSNGSLWKIQGKPGRLKDKMIIMCDYLAKQGRKSCEF